jgi:crotonobetainyl-CoA:carnitine CoA-transferase CaiB-like acyl-CoA transferase
MGITIGPINNIQDIGIDPHYQARDSFIDVEDPSNGVMLRIPNFPFRLLNTQYRIRFPGLPLVSANRVT